MTKSSYFYTAATSAYLFLMPTRQHHYALTVLWTGNAGSGTSAYHAYERSHIVQVSNMPDLHGSSDAAFRGDKTKHNPEVLFIASLAACHMLWFLHLCAEACVIVTAYTDKATGIMEQDKDGGGRFTEVTLNPVVTISGHAATDQLHRLHKQAHELCFIARSVNFPVYHKPVWQQQQTGEESL